MAGLLYKDYVAVHGKIYTLALLSATVLLMMSTVLPLPGDAAIVVGALVLVAAMMLPIVVTSFSAAIFAADSGVKKQAYLLSLPISKKQYVASKYIFILICYYVVLSVCILWAQFVSVSLEQALADSFITDGISMIPLLTMVCVLISAIELPFFVAVGVKAGNAIKICILFAVFLAVFGYMLFGDLTLIEHLNMRGVVEYMKEHKEIFFALQSFGTVSVGIMYYLSYSIASRLYIRKEPGDEE